LNLLLCIDNEIVWTNQPDEYLLLKCLCVANTDVQVTNLDQQHQNEGLDGTQKILWVVSVVLAITMTTVASIVARRAYNKVIRDMERETGEIFEEVHMLEGDKDMDIIDDQHQTPRSPDSSHTHSRSRLFSPNVKGKVCSIELVPWSHNLQKVSLKVYLLFTLHGIDRIYVSNKWITFWYIPIFSMYATLLDDMKNKPINSFALTIWMVWIQWRCFFNSILSSKTHSGTIFHTVWRFWSRTRILSF